MASVRRSHRAGNGTLHLLPGRIVERVHIADRRHDPRPTHTTHGRIGTRKRSGRADRLDHSPEPLAARIFALRIESLVPQTRLQERPVVKSPAHGPLHGPPKPLPQSVPLLFKRRRSRRCIIAKLHDLLLGLSSESDADKQIVQRLHSVRSSPANRSLSCAVCSSSRKRSYSL